MGLILPDTSIILGPPAGPEAGWANSAEASTTIVVVARIIQFVEPSYYDGDIMMSRTQITLDPELQRRAHRRASDLGVSFAEYVRRLVARDLGKSETVTSPAAVFDLGASGDSQIAKHKDAMIAEAFRGKPVSLKRHR